MAPFVPDGVYKIRNVQFDREVADLTFGDPRGPIFGMRDRPTNHNDKWIITNIGLGNGGNEITIESQSVQGSFANADQFPGAELVGSDTQTVWTIVKVDHGYYIQSPNAQFVWELSGPSVHEHRVPIVLIPFTAKDDTKWVFNRVEE